MDREAWRATVHGVAIESDMTQQLNNNNYFLMVLKIKVSGDWIPLRPLACMWPHSYRSSYGLCSVDTHPWCLWVSVLCCAVSLSRVRLFATVWTVTLQAPLSLGFSRREYWSGLLFSSPEDLPDPGIEPRSPALQVDSLLSEPPGKPKNTVVDSLSLLQGIFPTQESNWVLLHYKWILYQLCV